MIKNYFPFLVRDTKIRGLSPYVGAVMLVVIAVAVGFFLSNWYSSMVKYKANEFTSQNKYLELCENIEYSYYGIKFNESGNNYFDMYVKNEGSDGFTIGNITIWGINGNEQRIEESYYLQPGETKKIFFQVNTSEIDHIDLITMYIRECPQKQITIEGYEIQ